jgi:AraC-like DNA-binding protein
MRLDNLASVRLPNYSARIMREVAGELGIDWVRLADTARVDASTFDDPNAELSGLDELRLQRAFAEATRREPSAWFATGLRFHILTMGPLGIAALAAPDTQGGLRNVMHFQDLCPSLLHYGLIYKDGDLVGLSADDEGVPADIRENHLERALACVTRFLTDMWQDSRLISHVEIKLDRPKNWCGCEDKFGFPVHFGARRTRWVFEPGAGWETLPLASPLLEETYQRLCKTLLERTRATESIVDRLYGLLVRSGRQPPSVTEAARHLNVSERTLHRQLAREGISYGALVDNTREEQARYLLSTSSLSLERIAELVGFGEATSFSRAFKRWTGMSPMVYRNRDSPPSQRSMSNGTVAGGARNGSTPSNPRLRFSGAGVCFSDGVGRGHE